MANRDRILIVDDESSICHFLSTVLGANGYDAIVAHTGSEAYSIIMSQALDLVVLDLGLPDLDGISLIESVRAWSEIPIIVISARMQERDKVQALDLGADDYITKPFGASEFLARVRTAIRHYRSRRIGTGRMFTGKLAIGDLSVDFNKHQVLIKGQNARLTQNEFRIVAALARNAGKVLTYDYLLKEIWGPGMANDNQILRVNMANIRRKIEDNPSEPKYILTEIGVGYRLLEDEG
ncbi:MAG: response regulator transcription factor [Clostridiales bacterium]|nr:response regulator transcription factor [Clostridiales bacterium]